MKGLTAEELIKWAAECRDAHLTGEQAKRLLEKFKSEHAIAVRGR